MLQTYKVRVRTIDRHGLILHKMLFNMLKPCHMSADEAEVEDEHDDRQKHPRVYIIVDAAWQSRVFKTFVRTLELWNIADWRQSVKTRLPSGNAPRTRVEKGVTRMVDSKAPEGLWRNCYSKAWLDSLPGHVRARLNIINSDYDFSLPTYQKPAYIDPKDFPVPEEEDEAAEEEEEDSEHAVGGDA
ncbi:hypothetical protein LXA43DRAFT_905891 [Ganoderma leucocontextum]|nr:hypothetical protein LXA43DRAFT_905891 [Ganoderma leucocontextum]